MAILSLPRAIHVDPNMHENLYRDLLAFAVVFDHVSLYAVFGGRLEKHFRPGISGFIDLVQSPDPRDSAFVLTAPQKFLDRSERDKRFGANSEMQWTDYEAWLVGPKRGAETVIETTGADKIRDAAWRQAIQYRKTLHKRLRENEALALAYNNAKSQFEVDRKSPATGGRVLPATFFHEVTYKGSHYAEFLAGGDVLPLLAFEHYTKPGIIKSIAQKLRQVDPSVSKLVMYVPAGWHSLLLEGLSFDKSMGGSGKLIEMANEVIDEEGGLLFEQVRRLSLDGSTDSQRVQAVLEFRRQRGPASFRKLIEQTVGIIAAASTPGAKQVAITQAVNQLKWLCERMGNARKMANTMYGILRPLLFSAGPLLAVYVPDLRHQFDFWAAWTSSVIGAHHSRELCFKIARHMVEPGYADDEKEFAERLLPLFGSAQPHNSISGTLASE